MGQKFHSATVSKRLHGTNTLAPSPRAAELAGRPEVVSGWIAQGRLLRHDTHGRSQRLVGRQGFLEGLERLVPAPGRLENAEALPRVVENIAGVSIGLYGVLAAAGSGGGLVAGGLAGRRIGIAEDAQAHALPKVAQELDTAGLGSCRREPRTKL